MVLWTGMLVARVSSRGSSTVRCEPAACGAAEAAAGVLTTVPFAQGVRSLTALMAVLGVTVMRAMRACVRASCGLAAVPAGFVACGVAAAAACVLMVVWLGEFFDDLGTEGVVGKPSLAGFFCFHDGV